MRCVPVEALDGNKPSGLGVNPGFLPNLPCLNDLRWFQVSVYLHGDFAFLYGYGRYVLRTEDIKFITTNTVVMQKEVLDSLVMLGFTEYEAKAYAGLVGLGMGTAREVHEISGVPHGRIYSVLKTLAEKGYVTVQKGSPTYFRAEDPDVVIGGLKVRLNDQVDRSLAYLKSLRIETGHPLPFWSIHSEWGINRRIRSMIENARKEIIIFFMDSSLLFPFMKEIQEADRRISVSIISLNEDDPGAGLPVEMHVPNERLRAYMNEMKNTHMSRAEHLSKSAFILFADGKESLILEQASGGNVATVIMAPELTFMMRSFMVAFDPLLGAGEKIL